MHRKTALTGASDLMNPAHSGAGEHTAVHTHLLVDVYRPLLL